MNGKTTTTTTTTLVKCLMRLDGSGADPVKGHGCTHVHPIIFAKTSKLGGLSNS
jgi:hypothetical protein